MTLTSFFDQLKRAVQKTPSSATVVGNPAKKEFNMNDLRLKFFIFIFISIMLISCKTINNNSNNDVS